jgi:hypothetical protein
MYFFSFHGSTALGVLGLLIVEASRSHIDTPHSVGRLWTSDQLRHSQAFVLEIFVRILIHQLQFTLSL